uniref:Secreted protein n=1 Tax=Setaria viridis TaxID=4556 RepID=A0A4U6UX27_SETVI|nr:hypothetical protein SEVIR_4G048701v2 [Setaria viridis]
MWFVSKLLVLLHNSCKCSSSSAQDEKSSYNRSAKFFSEKKFSARFLTDQLVFRSCSKLEAPMDNSRLLLRFPCFHCCTGDACFLCLSVLLGAQRAQHPRVQVAGELPRHRRRARTP